MTVKKSAFVDKDIGHVLTENFRIIKKYRKLRKLVEKVPQYREQCYINWNTNLKKCREAVRDYETI